MLWLGAEQKKKSACKIHWICLNKKILMNYRHKHQQNRHYVVLFCLCCKALTELIKCDLDIQGVHYINPIAVMKASVATPRARSVTHTLTAWMGQMKRAVQVFITKSQQGNVDLALICDVWMLMWRLIQCSVAITQSIFPQNPHKRPGLGSNTFYQIQIQIQKFGFFKYKYKYKYFLQPWFKY